MLPLLAVVATSTVFAAATDRAAAGRDSVVGPSLGQLGQAGGLTRGFTVAANLVGLLVLVVFIASTASERSQGTIRTLHEVYPRNT